MNTGDLVNYLSGKTELLEFTPTAAMVGSTNPLSQPSVRGEKLQQLWDEMMVRLWALWADILDINEQCYEEARPVLEELKSMMPQQCKAAMPTFKILMGIVQKYLYIDKYTPQPTLKLFFARMKYLAEELRYICDQFDPEVPRAPETPVKSRMQWDQDQVLKRKDAKAAKQPGAELGGMEEPVDQEMQPEAPTDAQHIVFEPTQAMQDPTGTFMPDRQDVGKDQAGPNNQDTTARGKNAPMGQDDMGDEEPNPEDLENPEDPADELDPDEFPDADELPDLGPEKNVSQQPVNPAMTQMPMLPVQPGQSPLLPGQRAQPQQPPQQPGQQAPPGKQPPFARAGKEPPFKGGDKGKTPDRENGEKPETPEKAEKKPAKKLKESKENSSMVLSSFAEAVEHETELEAHFLTAGAALRTCLESKSDVHSAHVEIGEATPGGLPRLDLFVEWETESRPSDCYGYARLWLDEGVGIVVLDACDKVRDVLRFDEGLTDSAIAGRMYSALTEVYDPSTERIWEKARVIPALYRLIERAQRGESVPARAFAQVLDCLRGPLGMQEAVRVPGTSIRLCTEMKEDDLDTMRAGRLDYHFSWAVKTPLTHGSLPDLNPFDGSMTKPVPGDEDAEIQPHDDPKNPYIKGSAIATGQGFEAYLTGEDRWPLATWQTKVQAVKEALEMVKEKAQANPADYAYQAGVRQLETRLQHLYDLPKVESATHWRTPSLVIDLKEGAVLVGPEKLPKDSKDEDVTARIASMAHQKESAQGPVYEPFLNKPGNRLTEMYSRSGLELEQEGDSLYCVYWHGKTIGRVERHDNGLWSAHLDPRRPTTFEPDDIGEYAGPHIAALALARGQGLHEAELAQGAVRTLGKLTPPDFIALCEAVGIESTADRIEATTAFVQKLRTMEFGDNWIECFERQLTNPDGAAYTEALAYAVAEEGMRWGAVSYADAHWREFL